MYKQQITNEAIGNASTRKGFVNLSHEAIIKSYQNWKTKVYDKRMRITNRPRTIRRRRIGDLNLP